MRPSLDGRRNNFGTLQFKGFIDSNMKYLEIISEQNELRIREHGKGKMG